jgi:phage tail sheath gpL-like
MTSPNVSFASIPSSIRKPGKYLEFNTALAVRTLPANRQRVLIIGQRTSVGTVAAGTVTAVFSDAEASTYFGIGSMLHRMVRAAITANPYLDLSVLPLDDDGTTKATWTVTLANAATKAGALRLWVGNQYVEISVANGTAAADIATALNAELAKFPDLPVTAGVAGAVVTLTARNAGTIANQIDIGYELINVTATTVTIATGVTGATDPDISASGGLPKVAGWQYDIIISPYNATADITKLITHLDTYSGPMEQRPGIGVLAYDGALGSCTTITLAANSGRICMGYLRGTKSPSFELAAAFGSVIASEEDPARPLNTLTLAGINAPTVDQRLTRTEQESCLNNGAAPLEVQPGDKVGIVRAISTYTKDGANTPDISLLDITTIRTLDYVRRAIRERIALRFPREKLSAKTAGRVKGEILDVLRLLEELEIVENVAANVDGVIVERDLQDPNRLNAKIPTDIVNGLHIFAGRIDLLL